MSISGEPRIKIQAKGKSSRNLTTQEVERLRGFNWNLYQKGQKIYGSGLNIIFSSFSKLDDLVIVEELSKEDYNNVISPEIKGFEKYSEPQTVDINGVVIKNLKEEKVNNFKYLFNEFQKTPEFKTFTEKGFRLKFERGSGIYFQATHKINTSIEFNILVESGAVSYLEFSKKHAAEVRKYNHLREGVMSLEDVCDAVKFILSYSS